MEDCVLSARRPGFTLAITFAAAVGLLLSGCANRSYTNSRSATIAEAEGKGIQLPSLEEEKALFEQQDKIQGQRLIALLKQRGGSDYRDTTYRIGPNDQVEINVFDVPELNLTAPVNQAGLISLPLVGAVEEGLYCSLAHGTRGLLTGGLAADLLAAQICGQLPPLPADLLRALAPLPRLSPKARRGA